MFGQKRVGTIIEPPEPPPSPLPTAEVVQFPRARIVDPRAEGTRVQDYAALARELEYEPAELIHNELLAFLKEREMQVFDYAEVDKYLRSKAPERIKWIWRPLRDKDSLSFGWHFSEVRHEVNQHGGYHPNDPCCRPYQRLVPQHAVEKVKIIESVFRDKVAFFVTDYESERPDPFLGVVVSKQFDTGPANAVLAIDVWDEPDFGFK